MKVFKNRKKSEISKKFLKMKLSNRKNFLTDRRC